MPMDEQFSATMRIDIPPDLLQGSHTKSKFDTSKIRGRPVTVKIPRAKDKESSDTKYQQLLQSIYDAAVITDLQGHIIDSNIRASEFLIYNQTELGQMNILDLISGAEDGLLATLCENLQKERFALIQAYCVRKDQTFFPAEIAVNSLRFEEVRLCFFIRDVTVRRQAEEMLRTEHHAIQNAGNGIAIANVQGILEYVNPAVLRLWGFEDPEELLQKDVRSLWADPEAAEAMIRVILEEHQNWAGEMIGRRRDGTDFCTQVSAAGNRDSDGELVGMVMSVVDITDRKRAEEAMKESERHRAMLASLGAACHHLGQPATVILANLGLMKRKLLPPDHEFKELLHTTTEAAEELQQILYKLNTAGEYVTQSYIEDAEPDSAENQILDINRATQHGEKQPPA